jgi:hypothetical protein
VRLIAATRDPTPLKPASTWYLATSFPLAHVSTEQVYELYRLREWIEHFYKPVKHELGWADDQLRTEQAIVRHWQLVLLAYTFSLLVGTVPTATAPPTTAAPTSTATDPSPTAEATGGGKIGPRPSPRVRGRVVWTATLRRVRSWLCPWAHLQRYWTRWSRAGPPPELAALLAHVAHSLPLEAPAAPT